MQKRVIRMRASIAFSHREEQLLLALRQTKDVDQAIAACMMALEQTACELAQDEQDDAARQRQQAVMACVRRAPQMLRACAARGELVMEETMGVSKTEKLQKAAVLLGGFLLAALAVYEMIEGKAAFAALQLAGACLLAFAGRKKAGPDVKARGVACVDADAAVRLLREMCQAADVCVSDLQLLEKEAGTARLSGTVDEAMIDLLVSQLEAKASGRPEMAVRSLDRAEQYLHMLGIEVIFYSEESAKEFDVLPTMGEARTIRPALVKDGQVFRRGTAALPMERSVGA